MSAKWYRLVVVLPSLSIPQLGEVLSATVLASPDDLFPIIADRKPSMAFPDPSMRQLKWKPQGNRMILEEV
jgi:hypothetical protein